MARLARLVIPGLPHHVTQRGNRREQVFFNESDYLFYRELIFNAAQRAGCEIWSWCLMPNHVHMILVPSDEDGLRKTFADAHRRYTGRINARMQVTGHLWQGRFGSVVLDEDHLYHAVRYVSLNPVRAGLVAHPADWRWSSVRDHLEGKSHGPFNANAAISRFGKFSKYLGTAEDENDYAELRAAETVGRPLGSLEWRQALEQRTGMTLVPQQRGRRAGT